MDIKDCYVQIAEVLVMYFNPIIILITAGCNKMFHAEDVEVMVR